jgi:Uma2 family endonuclease
VGHNLVVHDVTYAVTVARVADLAYRLRCIQTTGLNLVSVGDGYVPDLILLDEKVLTEASRADARHLHPEQVGLVVEVTSPTAAWIDRTASSGDGRKSKVNGYARAEVPHCLLIDRDPRHPHVALLSHPDRESGLYLSRQTWIFGEMIRLPEPFDFEINTEEWRHWAVTTMRSPSPDSRGNLSAENGG